MATERLLRAYLHALRLDAERYLRRGFLPADLIDEIAEVSAVECQLRGGEPDA